MKSSIDTSVPGPADPARDVQPFSSLVTVDIAALTHRGRLRENNEDQFHVARMSRALETVTTSLPPGEVPERAEEVNHVMIVADGMGGHAAGELASRLAIRSLVNIALGGADWILKLDASVANEIQERARRFIRQIGAVVFKEGSENPGCRGMGTTLTMARSLGRHLMIVHVGDSRAYLFRSGHLHRLTKDHTYAQMLVDTGHLQPNEVGASGVGHILTNAIGGSSEHVEVDVDVVRLEPDDRLLLCSDGLSDLVAENTMADVLADSAGSERACARLVQLALDRGGRDNVTVIVAGYTFPQEG
jgi:protein phosphatase